MRGFKITEFFSSSILDPYTLPGIYYYHVSKVKQYGWPIYSLLINEFEVVWPRGAEIVNYIVNFVNLLVYIGSASNYTSPQSQFDTFDLSADQNNVGPIIIIIIYYYELYFNTVQFHLLKLIMYKI